MKMKIATGSICAAVFYLCLGNYATAQESKTKPLAIPAVEEALLVSVTARIEALDLAKREVTLKGPLGNMVTFVVDERVKRLDEMKVGDEVTADYYISIAGELRAPTAQEKQSPLVILQEKAKAPPGTSPAGGGLRVVRAVVTVEGLDRPTKSLTVKGPLGKYATIRARNLQALEKMRLGDTIVVTYTEALAVSLEKVPAKSDKG